MTPALSLTLLALSSLFQALAALIALQQMTSVAGRYRLAWACVSLALVFMVQRRLAPLSRLLEDGQQSNSVDVVVGLVISLLMVIGLFGIRQLFLEMRRQEARLNELARFDDLTGLPNRRETLHRLAVELLRCQRSHQPVSLLMFDIDHFKVVNDTYGHAAGDEVLRETAHSACQNLRASDTCGRIGGEEFLVILPNTPAEQALIAAERLRATVAGQPQGEDEPLTVTISIGVALFDGYSVLGVDQLIASADQALYRAKNNGRNRIALASAQ